MLICFYFPLVGETCRVRLANIVHCCSGFENNRRLVSTDFITVTHTVNGKHIEGFFFTSLCIQSDSDQFEF